MFISVLSYNIYHDVKIEQTSSSYNIIEKWDKRKDQVLEVLQKSAADIICLQEDLPHQYKYLMEKLKNVYSGIDYSVDYIFPNKASSARQVIIYKNNIIKLIDSGNFYLSPTPDQISHSNDLKKGIIRYLPVTWAKFEKDNTHFFVFNVHMNAWKENAQLRIKYAKLILKRIKKITNNMAIPVILVGDFNSNMTRDKEVFNVILKSFKTDNRLLDDTQEDFNLLLSPYPKSSSTNFDYIFVSKRLKIDRLDVLGKSRYWSTTKKTFVYPSDHKALLGFIKFPNS